MNAMQFLTALLEAQQRARTAIGAHMQAMTPPQPQQPTQGSDPATLANPQEQTSEVPQMENGHRDE